MYDDVKKNDEFLSMQHILMARMNLYIYKVAAAYVQTPLLYIYENSKCAHRIC